MYQRIAVSMSQYQKILGRHTLKALQLEGELHLKGEGKGPSTKASTVSTTARGPIVSIGGIKVLWAVLWYCITLVSGGVRGWAGWAVAHLEISAKIWF
jgi:hypothetical protein